MTKEELQKLINDLQNQLEEAQDKLEKLYKNERWKPKQGQKYYNINSLGDVNGLGFFEENIYDNLRYDFYNCFKTQEEAEKERNKILIRRKPENIARRLNGDNEIDWNNYIQAKFYIDFNKNKGLGFGKVIGYKSQGTVYCLSNEFLDIAKEEIGEQELIDYIKGE